MTKFQIFAAAFLLSCATAGWLTGAAYAEETKTVQRTVTVYSLSDNPELEKKVTAICGDTAVKLTSKARAACDTKTFPPLAKNKDFRNSGIGAEFNTLARNRS
jgi:hypothetical protein